MEVCVNMGGAASVEHAGWLMLLDLPSVVLERQHHRVALTKRLHTTMVGQGKNWDRAIGSMKDRARSRGGG